MTRPRGCASIITETARSMRPAAQAPPRARAMISGRSCVLAAKLAEVACLVQFRKVVYREPGGRGERGDGLPAARGRA